MWKKRMTVLVILLAMLLSGCGVLNEVNQSLNYVNQATTYINEASAFAEDITALSEQILTDPEARAQLLQKLDDMKQRIQDFNGIEPPKIAQQIHEKLVTYNDTLQQGINDTIQQIQTGVWDPQMLQNSGLLETIGQITNILDQLNQLG
ncbi:MULTISPECIES: DUF6376 family protein [unclassified Paenibacillus]|uniref:DUF6376 family protein n=1 Tax=unclassified Paenibacillus TaxID=185978 RepID=UPI001AE4762F|nr:MULTISPECIES: DUF6376 family protein [unclassified Paenibacillus]MBP1156935.1 TolA-binding protein [Paenibacillus sp. PvP091]MBP1172326.1 TolA-binding protein [Paenibacillus sp. PvR098]MBP2438707.1 TolA-binding protein [Paenibacillus sp. PvP052]